MNKNPVDMLRKFKELWDKRLISPRSPEYGLTVRHDVSEVYSLYDDITNYLTELDDANCCPDCCEPLSDCDCDEDDDCLVCGQDPAVCGCDDDDDDCCDKKLQPKNLKEQNMCEHKQEIVLGGCYHDNVVYTTGYEINGGKIELDNKLFTNFDTGFDDGVAGELNRLRAFFNPQKDAPRFAVALRPIKVIRTDDYGIINKYGCHCNLQDDTDSCDVCSERFKDNNDDNDDDDCCDEECCTNCECWRESNSAHGNEVVAPPLNAFDRAKWIKSQE